MLITNYFLISGASIFRQAAGVSIGAEERSILIRNFVKTRPGTMLPNNDVETSTLAGVINDAGGSCCDCCLRHAQPQL